MQEFSFIDKYFGTTVTVSLVMESGVLAQKIADEVFLTCANYEAQFSRFLPESELSILNQEKELIVSDEFLKILLLCRELFIATGGIFNPLVQVSRLGYQGNFPTLADSDLRVDQSYYDINFGAVVIDEISHTVRLKDQQALDFGGILKGYLAEKIAKGIMAEHEKCQGVIVNLGGDLHTRGVDQAGQAFLFMIYNPVLDVEIPITLSNTSLTTSGTYKRQWETDVGLRHHILAVDGISNPNSSIISASFVNESGAVADAYAKVLLIKNGPVSSQFMPPTKYQYLLINEDGTAISTIT